MFCTSSFRGIFLLKQFLVKSKTVDSNFSSFLKEFFKNFSHIYSLLKKKLLFYTEIPTETQGSSNCLTQNERNAL